MKQTVRELRGDEVLARDGTIGSVKDVYFDDERWTVRYLVVDTGNWLTGKRVLVSPAAVETGLSSGDKLRLAMLREQVESAPGVDADRPVSRQEELKAAQHFGYPYYWTGPLLWGAMAYPVPPAVAPQECEPPEAADGDPHLRSGNEVIGYAIHARDGEIGEVQDFVVDDRDWRIRDVVVDTTKWWPGGHVAVHPDYVERIDWKGRAVHVLLTREEVKRAGAVTPRR